jgi:hypothetical protein
MIATYVSPRPTPFTFESAAEAMRAALGRPSREVLALALAKCALETGRWQKIFNYNYGNIKAGASYVGMYTCLPILNEVIKGRVRWFRPDGEVIRLQGGTFTPTSAPRVAVPPGEPQTRMRAHANRFDGAFEYASFMRSRSAMWSAMHTGDPHAFVPAMKAGGYFTADAAVYERSVRSIWKEFALRLEGRSPEETRLPEPEWNEARAFASMSMFVAQQLEAA